MFDNLKEKLGSFRKDAEEAAEENVEEIEDVDEVEDAEDIEDVDDVEDIEDSEDVEAENLEASAVEDDERDGREAGSDGEAAEDGDRLAAERSETDAGTQAAPAEQPATATEQSETTVETADETPTETADETSAATEAPETTTEPADDSVGESEAVPETEPDLAPEFETATADSESPTAADSTESQDSDVDADAGVESWVTAPAPEVEDDDPSTSDSETGEPRIDASAVAPEEPAADADEDDDSTGISSKARSLVKGQFVIEEEDLEGPLHELEMALLSSDVEMGVAEEILDNIRDELVGETRTFTTSTGDVVEEALRDAIYDVISVGQFDFDQRIAEADKPLTIVFTGVNGVGKTTSIAKLSRYFEERGYSTVMANGDTYRAGANEQIQEHARALDTKLITHEQGGDPAAVLYDGVEYAEANDIDIVLGDTAGRLHTNEGLMDQLEKIDRVVEPEMTLFVDEAVAGQDAVNRAREFNEAAETDGAILTKADADSNGGAAISIAHVTGKPILFLGIGQGYDDIERFDPDEMIDRLLDET